MDRYEINKALGNFREHVNDLFVALRVDVKREKLSALDLEIQSPDFWNDQKKANLTISEANSLREDINLYEKLKKGFDDLIELDELAKEDESMLEMLDLELEEFSNELNEAENRALLSGEYDELNAIVELHPGAGGTESMDWAQMLYRMYQRFAQKQGYKFEVLDYQAGDEAGIKSVTFSLKGKYAYGYLKGERGVHRLVRISPFDSGARRHTSFCSCDVSPEITDTTAVEIKDEDLKIDVYHSSGAGGQSVNTTDSAVRMTHLPTGIVVTCQNERSQIKNREVALKILKSKLLEREILERDEKLKALKGSQMGINFGSQIRSYVFCPYTLVKDHRTGFENNNVNDVMDGNVLPFMQAYLKFERGEKND